LQLPHQCKIIRKQICSSTQRNLILNRENFQIIVDAKVLEFFHPTKGETLELGKRLG